MKYRSRTAGAVVAVSLALLPCAAMAEDAAWERWVAVPGVIDVAGPRTDGRLVVAGAGALYLLDPASGSLEPFARGPGGYHEDPGKEAYLAVSNGGHVDSVGCDFARDEVFILRQHGPFGVNRVNATGDESGSFANVPGVSVLTGITFDTGGAFDQRLLVTGRTTAGTTALFAVDCNGGVTVITRSIPPVEGGIAVAPNGFGHSGGALIAPDAVSGRVYAIASNGRVASIGRPSFPRGAEIGVETVGFVPAGFFDKGGSMYYADAATGHLLRLSSAALAAAGAREGEPLVAAERGAALVAIHCDPSCASTYVIQTPSRARGEGHFAFVLNAAEVQPTPPPIGKPAGSSGLVDFVGAWGIPTGVFILLVAFLAAVAVQAMRQRAR